MYWSWMRLFFIHDRTHNFKGRHALLDLARFVNPARCAKKIIRPKEPWEDTYLIGTGVDASGWFIYFQKRKKVGNGGLGLTPKYDISDVLAGRRDMTSSRTTSRWGKVINLWNLAQNFFERCGKNLFILTTTSASISVLGSHSCFFFF